MEKAMIFAAGLGTRLRPLTDNMPKALVRIGDKALIDIVIDKLAKSGFRDIVVNVHHFADQIERHLSASAPEGVKISISDERDMLRDTGGGIRHARPLLGQGNFLVHNVDIISGIDLRRFASGIRADALATLAVSDRKTSRYLLFDGDMRLVGWTNTSTGEVRSPYPDIDVSACRKLAFSGIHILSHEVFGLFETGGFGEKFSIIDFYLKVAAECPVYGLIPENPDIIDVGKPEALASARDFIACGMRRERSFQAG